MQQPLEPAEVLDPTSIAEQLGAEFTEGPAHVPENAGLFIGALSCNGLYTMGERALNSGTGNTRSTRGFMYLNIAPTDTPEEAKELYNEIWEQDFQTHSEYDPAEWAMVFSDEQLEGDWDEATIFGGTGIIDDRVWAYYLDGSYVVQIQLSWTPDREVHSAVLREEADLSAFATYYDFTVLDIGQWVKDTYLPQVHESIDERVEERIGE